MNRASPDKTWVALAMLGGIAYPFLVYFTMNTLPLWAFFVIGLSLIALRLYSLRRKVSVTKAFWGFCVVGLLLALLFVHDELAAVQAYPVLISLTVASVFGYSLLFPPTLVERIARLTEPDLSAGGIVYTRRVTWIWFVFLIMNAAVSLSTILWGSMSQWTLWNGLVSYLLMGMLFVCEYAVRKIVKP